MAVAGRDEGKKKDAHQRVNRIKKSPTWKLKGLLVDPAESNPRGAGGITDFPLALRPKAAQALHLHHPGGR